MSLAEILWHPRTLEHDPGPAHPETSARVAAILERLRSWQGPGELVFREAQPASREELTRIHPPWYLDRLAAVSARGGGRLDPDTVMNGASYEAACCAAGAAVAAVRSALSGRPAFAVVRPPGHHATATQPMGFCLINHVVLAAYTALDTLGTQRVLIVDWDVHHGNGTQALVERDPRIRYVSMHQWPLYPGTGRADERGVGNIFNVPLPPGLDRRRYVAELEAAVTLAMEGWRPDVLLISAGFDGLAGDPLAGFTLEPEDYATWTRSLRALGIPMASVLEGGYAPGRVAAAAAAHVGALL